MPSIGHVFHVRLLQSLLTAKKNISMYDFGCGAGELLEVIPRHKIKEYVGVDINQSSIVSATKKYGAKKTHFRVNKPTTIPTVTDSPKDLFIAVGVFQYLDERLQTKIIKKAHAILKRNGVLAISCAVDHKLYHFLNIYRFFVPHGYVKRDRLLNILRSNNFEVEYAKEKGLIVSPLFSHVVIFFFDAFDKLIFRTQGELGPIGKTIRTMVKPLMALEYALPVDYGYTLFIQARKKS
jgi:SAM-dependent methyltransferase